MKQPASMNEIELARRKGIDCNIVSFGFKIGVFDVLKKLDVDVGGDDSASWPHLLAKPSGY